MARTMGFHPINLGSIPSKNKMFKWVFSYYTNNNDTPSVIFKINLWSYINVRLFKLKYSQTLNYFIFLLENLQQKIIKIFHKSFYFENFFYNYVVYNIFFLILLSVLI